MTSTHFLRSLLDATPLHPLSFAAQGVVIHLSPARTAPRHLLNPFPCIRPHIWYLFLLRHLLSQSHYPAGDTLCNSEIRKSSLKDLGLSASSLLEKPGLPSLIVCIGRAYSVCIAPFLFGALFEQIGVMCGGCCIDPHRKRAQHVIPATFVPARLSMTWKGTTRVQFAPLCPARLLMTKCMTKSKQTKLACAL